MTSRGAGTDAVRDDVIAAVKERFSQPGFGGLWVAYTYYERCRSDAEDIWFERCGPDDEGAQEKHAWRTAHAEEVINAVLDLVL